MLRIPNIHESQWLFTISILFIHEFFGRIFRIRYYGMFGMQRMSDEIRCFCFFKEYIEIVVHVLFIRMTYFLWNTINKLVNIRRSQPILLNSNCLAIQPLFESIQFNWKRLHVLNNRIAKNRCGKIPNNILFNYMLWQMFSRKSCNWNYESWFTSFSHSLHSFHRASKHSLVLAIKKKWFFIFLLVWKSTNKDSGNSQRRRRRQQQQLATVACS